MLAYEESENGFLTASEVAKLELDAELAVLSACNTGSGRYFRCEGLVGMGRAFMVAGSRKVLVSLWPVDSLATQTLMESFYDELAEGLRPPQALTAAHAPVGITRGICSIYSASAVEAAVARCRSESDARP